MNRGNPAIEYSYCKQEKSCLPDEIIYADETTQTSYLQITSKRKEKWKWLKQFFLPEILIKSTKKNRTYNIEKKRKRSLIMEKCKESGIFVR